jgi:hypothetical protein
MPRGPARDRLPDELAARFRDAVERARQEKGLTNDDLAQYLKWDVRNVTNAMQAGRSLRAPNAGRLLKALYTLPARGEDGRRLTDSEAIQSGRRVAARLAPISRELANHNVKRWPAALIASYDLELFADLLAEAIVRRSGFSERKRPLIKSAVVHALAANTGELISSASQQLTRGFMTKSPRKLLQFSEETVARILARFGYHVSK